MTGDRVFSTTERRSMRRGWAATRRDMSQAVFGQIGVVSGDAMAVIGLLDSFKAKSDGD